MRFLKQSGLALGAVVLSLAGMAERPASACGGLFCNNVPVVQTGEEIVFVEDQAANTVEATIAIRYQGAAPDFAWLLPLVSEPVDTQVGSSFTFQIANRL